MVPYRALAQHLQNTARIPLDAALATIAAVSRGLGAWLAPDRAAVLRGNVAPELGQLIREGAKGGRAFSAAGEVLESVAASLEVHPFEAKRRFLILLEGLMEAMTPWDKLEYVETLLILRREVYDLPVPAPVAA